MLFPSRLVGLALLFLALPAGARTLEVGPGKQFAQPSQAAAAAQDGDRVVIAPGQYFDCAVWRQNNLTVEGVSAQDTVITDKTCQGKALFVIPGSNVTVRNLTLTRARAPDGNGAGIRAEGRNLLVERVRFIDNQNGILAADQPQSEIIVRDSEFVRNGTCEQDCAHGIYANRLALLRVERSAFRETRQGHHVKSRAFRTEVLGCDIGDGPTGTASYLVDVPNGGAVVIQNNRLEKGPKAENHLAAISIGAEGVDRPTPEIRVEGNQFSADGAYATVFVVNLTATPAMLRDNQLRGQVKPLRGDGQVLR
jgi:Right handed beta helix region